MSSNVRLCYLCHTYDAYGKVGGSMLHINHQLHPQYHDMFIVRCSVRVMTMPGHLTQEFWCVCQKYCKGHRRQLNTANTWRRHLREAHQDEKDAIRLASRSDAFRAFVNAASGSNSRLDDNINRNDSEHPGPENRPVDNDHEAHSNSGQRTSQVHFSSLLVGQDTNTNFFESVDTGFRFSITQ